MYEYYNANAVGKLDEDCTVRSISCATGKSWDYIYEHLSDLAQEQGTMMDNSEFIVDYLDRRYKMLPVYDETIGEIANMYLTLGIVVTEKPNLYGL